MALITDDSSAGFTPDEAWKRLKGTGRQVKVGARGIRDTSAAGDIQATRIVQYAGTLADALVQMPACVAVPGLTEYARAQTNNPAYDPAAEVAAVIPRMEAVRDWIVANCPQDGAGYLLIVKFAPGGQQQPRMIPSAPLADLRTELDLLLATLN